jgi:hypothetical protein
VNQVDMMKAKHMDLLGQGQRNKAVGIMMLEKIEHKADIKMQIVDQHRPRLIMHPKNKAHQIMIDVVPHRLILKIIITSDQADAVEVAPAQLEAVEQSAAENMTIEEKTPVTMIKKKDMILESGTTKETAKVKAAIPAIMITIEEIKETTIRIKALTAMPKVIMTMIRVYAVEIAFLKNLTQIRERFSISVYLLKKNI